MTELRELSLLEAIKEAYREEMQRDDNVYLLGISIQAGTFPHTTGLCEEFGRPASSTLPWPKPA